MKLKFWFIFLIISSSCTMMPNRNIKEGEKVTIIGIAEDRKGGAIVTSQKDNAAYFLEGVASWKEKGVGRKVKVTGELLVTRNTGSKDKNAPVRQEMIGEKKTLLKPVWKFID